MVRGAVAILVVLCCACGHSSATQGDAGTSDDGSVDAASFPPPCTLAPAGDPTPIVQFDTRHAIAPSMAMLDTGATSGAASVAIQVFANAGTSGLPDDIQLARAHIAPPWPDGGTLDQPPQLFGQFSLGWGLLAETPSDPRSAALVWHQQTVKGVGQIQFRGMDVATWTPGPSVTVVPSGDAVYSFVSGAGVGAGGEWAGDGFALAWRDDNAPGLGPSRPVAALLDVNGAVVRGPSPLATAEDFPGRAPDLAWTGSQYLVATSYVDCLGGDACVPHSVVLQRLRANPDPDASVSIGLDFVESFPALDPSTAPGTPTITALDGRAWLVWSEALPGDAGLDMPHTVRLVTLDAGGHSMGAPVVLATGAVPKTHLSVAAGDAGILVTWPEDSAAITDETMPGASIVVVQRVGFDGAIDPPIRIPTTRIDDFGPVTSAAMAAPRGALLLWAGRSTVATHFDVAWLAQLTCAP